MCIITHCGEWRVIIPSVSCSCYYSPGYFSSSLLPGCCCLMLLPSGVFSAEPLLMHQFPACIVARTISFKCRVLLFPSLNFKRILLACTSNLYRPFYMIALSCTVSTVSPSLEWKMHSIVSETCRSLVSVLSRMSSRIDPCGSQLFNQPPAGSMAP